MQEEALFFMRSNLRNFTDILNTEEVQTGAACPAHWLHQAVEDGRCLLELAAQEGRLKEAEVLVKVGALADQVGEVSGLSPIHVAVKRGDLPLLKLLLKNRYLEIICLSILFKE
jgi:hypothetical protein